MSLRASLVSGVLLVAIVACGTQGEGDSGPTHTSDAVGDAGAPLPSDSQEPSSAAASSAESDTGEGTLGPDAPGAQSDESNGELPTDEQASSGAPLADAGLMPTEGHSGSEQSPTDGNATSSDLTEWSSIDNTDIDAATPEPEPPANVPERPQCEPPFPEIDGTLCAVHARCGSDQLDINCNDTGQGDYNCNCADHASSDGFVLLGVNSASACLVAYDVCTKGTASAVVDEPMCQRAQDTATEFACETSAQCSQLVHLDESITALVTDSSYARCIALEDGSYDCTCGNSRAGYNYTVSAVTPEQACDSGMVLCDPYSAPDFANEQSCEAKLEVRRDDDCERRYECQRDVPLANGVNVSVKELQSSSCSQTETGELFCDCAGSPETATFELLTSDVGLPACELATSACQSQETATPTGMLACDPYTTNASPGACSATTQCHQEGDIDGTPVAFYRPLQAYCSEGEATGEWSCTCHLGPISMTTEFSSADPEGVCVSAADACREVDLVLGLGPIVLGQGR